MLGLIGAVACEAADPYGEVPPAATAKSEKVTPAGETACVESVDGKDPSSLPECTGTKGVKGRCVARDGLGNFKDTFEQASCSADEACVPDEVVAKGSKIELEKCTAVLDNEGRCFWPLAKDIVANYDLLKGATKDQCAGDQVCAPCVNPLTQAETGLCKLGGGGSSSCGGAGDAGPAPAPGPAPAKGLAECCGGRGRCVPSDAVPADSRERLGPETCAGEAMLCAPNELVPVPIPGVTVKKCKTGFGLISGICVSKCAIEVRGEDFVKGNCDDDEMCTPCRFLPEGTAACNK
ncbi:MAG: hypothetical protein KF764_22515 [Labilithrix sp.]|nr:hypothetical protein [Labilithrix sp.]